MIFRTRGAWLEKAIKGCRVIPAKEPANYGNLAPVVEKFGGKVPRTREELMTLPGVGRKTANVVLSNAFGIPAFALDTHVQRLCRRLGWSERKTPLAVEEDICRLLPPGSLERNPSPADCAWSRVCRARKTDATPVPEPLLPFSKRNTTKKPRKRGGEKTNLLSVEERPCRILFLLDFSPGAINASSSLISDMVLLSWGANLPRNALQRPNGGISIEMNEDHRDAFLPGTCN